MQALTVEQMMPAIGTESIPMNISKAVRNNAGGVYNHLLFFKVWQALRAGLPGAQGPDDGPQEPFGNVQHCVYSARACC